MCLYHQERVRPPGPGGTLPLFTVPSRRQNLSAGQPVLTPRTADETGRPHLIHMPDTQAGFPRST